jgi:hypothetical protein
LSKTVRLRSRSRRSLLRWLVRWLLRLWSLLGGLGLGCLACRSIRLTAVGGGPQGEVVAQELHDKRAVAVRLLGEAVELGDGVVEGLLGKVAGAVGGVQDLVVEDREVEREAEADGMGWGELGLGDIGGVLCVHSLASWSD